LSFHAYESLGGQVLLLFLLALPVACASWTITHEEIFREVREYCVNRSQICKRMYQRKFFYVLTCEYCLSHYATAVLLIITRYRLVYDSWRGYLMAGLSIVWIANFYMAIFGRLRLELKSQRLEIAQGERRAEAEGENSPFSESVSLGTVRERR
jgi:hypothetical protein